MRASIFLLALVPLMVSGVACGGGSDPGSSGAAVERSQEQRAKTEALEEKIRRERQQRRQAGAPTPDEQRAERVATDFYAILGTEKAERNPDRTTVDSTSFCELMGEEARQQTIHYAEASSGIDQEWDCESAVELLVIRSKRAGGFKDTQRAEVIGVNADGDKATATVRFGARGPATSIALVKEGGEWKLGADTVAPAK